METDKLLSEEFFDIYTINSYKLAVFPNYIAFGIPKLQKRNLAFFPHQYFLFNASHCEILIEFLVKETIVAFQNEQPAVSKLIGNTTVTFLHEKGSKLEPSFTTPTIKFESENFVLALNVIDYYYLCTGLSNIFFKIYCYGSDVNQAISFLLSQLKPEFFKNPDFSSETFVSVFNQNVFEDKIYFIEVVQRHIEVLTNIKMLMETSKL